LSHIADRSKECHQGVTLIETRDRLLAEAAAHRARATKLKEEAAQALEAARRCERAAEILGPPQNHGNARIKPRPLNPPRADRTIGPMDVDTTGQPADVKAGAGRARRRHPAQRRLYEKGKTISSIAEELREGRPRVNAWFATGKTNRPIPRRHAEYLRDRYGIPLTDWARIAE
jgi:hypothetical protein